ncbi:MAG: dTDP-4-dehydrorhamnose reductase [Bacteroidota bacterium]
MPHLLITGANGQVGQELRQLSDQFPAFQYTFADVVELDITDAPGVADYFANQQFDYCINCAAYTAVDKAEEQRELARRVNAMGPELLARACAEQGTLMIQLSTDYVYHNHQNHPFKEDDPTHPQSVYARTKLAGDLKVLQNPRPGLVLRTSWVYSSFGHNFVKTMIRLGSERDQLGIVFDQIGTPTYARDLALAILQIIEKREGGALPESAFSGVYHYSNEGVCSWYDFALAIFELEKINCTTHPIETKDYPTPASRPPFSVLNKNKIKATFGLDIPHWRVALEQCLAAIKKSV